MKYITPLSLLVFLYCNNFKDDKENLLITGYFPSGGSTGVPTNTEISVTFNQNLYQVNFNTDNFITVHGDTIIKGEYNIIDNTLLFNPSNNLSYSTTYSVMYKDSDIDQLWTFTTCDTNCNNINSATAWATNPKIIKTEETFGEVVETTPIIFYENFLLIEFLREEENDSIQFSYQLRNINSNEIIINNEWGFGLGSAIVIGEHIYLFGSTDWNDYDGPYSWSRKPNIIGLTILDTNYNEINTDTLFYSSETETFFNSSVCQSPDGYIMAYEVRDEGLSSFSIRFRRSTDLYNWEIIGETLYSEKYAACPTIRYFDGYYYIFYLNRDGIGEAYDLSTLLVRTNDFINFEEFTGNQIFSPYVCVLSSNGFVNEGKNNSDIDFIEYQGHTYLFYHSGGNLNEGRGVERMAIYPDRFDSFIEEYWN